jgi:hypothetical protein
MGQQISKSVTEEELFQKNLKNCVIIYLKINNTELKDDSCMCIFNSIYEMLFERELKDDLCIFESIYDMLLSEYNYKMDYLEEFYHDYRMRQKLITSIIEGKDNLNELKEKGNKMVKKTKVIENLLTEILETFITLIYVKSYYEYTFFELLIRIIKTMNYTCELKIKLINNEIIVFKL